MNIIAAIVFIGQVGLSVVFALAILLLQFQDQNNGVKALQILLTVTVCLFSAGAALAGRYLGIW